MSLSKSVKNLYANDSENVEKEKDQNCDKDNGSKSSSNGSPNDPDFVHTSDNVEDSEDSDDSNIFDDIDEIFKLIVFLAGENHVQCWSYKGLRIQSKSMLTI